MFKKLKVENIVKFEDVILGTVIAKIEKIRKQQDIITGKMETRIDMIDPNGYKFTRFNPISNVKKATIQDLFENLKLII